MVAIGPHVIEAAASPIASAPAEPISLGWTGSSGPSRFRRLTLSMALYRAETQDLPRKTWAEATLVALDGLFCASNLSPSTHRMRTCAQALPKRCNRPEPAHHLALLAGGMEALQLVTTSSHTAIAASVGAAWLDETATRHAQAQSEFNAIYHYVKHVAQGSDVWLGQHDAASRDRFDAHLKPILAAFVSRGFAGIRKAVRHIDAQTVTPLDRALAALGSDLPELAASPEALLTDAIIQAPPRSWPSAPSAMAQGEPAPPARQQPAVSRLASPVQLSAPKPAAASPALAHAPAARPSAAPLGHSYLGVPAPASPLSRTTHAIFNGVALSCNEQLWGDLCLGGDETESAVALHHLRVEHTDIVASGASVIALVRALAAAKQFAVLPNFWPEAHGTFVGRLGQKPAQMPLAGACQLLLMPKDSQALVRTTLYGLSLRGPASDIRALFSLDGPSDSSASFTGEVAGIDVQCPLPQLARLVAPIAPHSSGQDTVTLLVKGQTTCAPLLKMWHAFNLLRQTD